MPPDLWIDSPIDVKQRHSQYLEAADRIEESAKKEEELAWTIRSLLKQLADLNDQMHRIMIENVELQRNLQINRYAQCEPYVNSPYVVTCRGDSEYGYYGK